MLPVVARGLLAPLRQLQVFAFIFFSGQSIQTLLNLRVKLSLVQSSMTFQNFVKIPCYLAITADEKLQRKIVTLLSGLRGIRRITQGCETEMKGILRWRNAGKPPLNSSAQISLGVGDYFSRHKHFLVFRSKLHWKVGTCRIMKIQLFSLARGVRGKIDFKRVIAFWFFLEANVILLQGL